MEKGILESVTRRKKLKRKNDKIIKYLVTSIYKVCYP